ncbi:hypothetical protein AB0M46_35165 [Dactylosporangium sp. NPDC051485]|uniref:hypothetical protein n=1 Tax=Dactylosporangium sp. NPDC051485 TaxID=3154846 RepID=UPI0034371253
MEIDLAFDDEGLEKAVRALAEDGDATAALELVAGEGDVHRREQAVSVLGAAGVNEIESLREFAARQSYRPERWLLLGAALAAAAWGVRESPGRDWRSNRREKRIDRRIIAQKALVAEARTALRRAAALSPGDAVPWSELTGVVIGAPLHATETADVFKRACVLAPGLYLAHARHLVGLTRRWYGSPDRVLAFAQARVAGRPDGHPLHALVALAHVEGYVDGVLRGMAPGRFWRAWRYFADPVVRDEVDSAADRLLAGPDDHPWSMSAHQAFAAVYHRAGDLGRARAHLLRSGERAAVWPWRYFGDPGRRFGAARLAALP